MSNFHSIQLGDVLTFQRGFDITKSAQSDGAVPIVSSSGVTSHHNKWKVKGPGVVIGRKGTLGTVHYIGTNFWPHDTTLWIKDFKGNDPRFLRYFLKTLHLENFDAGASNPTLNRNHIHKITVIFPKEVSTQRRIAKVLSTYDALIAINNDRIQIVGDLAEEIYREWFIRFRFPNHAKARVLKGIPEGWDVKRFDEIVEYYIGGGWGEENQSASFSEPAFVIRGTDIPAIQRGALNSCPYRFHKPSSVKSRQLRANDFVFEVSGGSKDQLLGRNVMVTQNILDSFEAPVIAASFCKQIRFRCSLVSPYFMKYFMKLYYDCDLVGIYQVQSTGISNYQFESFLKFQTIIIPPLSLQRRFEDVIVPLVELRDQIARENALLRETRELLIPRLISGKLGVSKIEFPSELLEELEVSSTGQTDA